MSETEIIYALDMLDISSHFFNQCNKAIQYTGNLSRMPKLYTYILKRIQIEYPFLNEKERELLISRSLTDPTTSLENIFFIDGNVFVQSRQAVSNKEILTNSSLYETYKKEFYSIEEYLFYISLTNFLQNPKEKSEFTHLFSQKMNAILKEEDLPFSISTYKEENAHPFQDLFIQKKKKTDQISFFIDHSLVSLLNKTKRKKDFHFTVLVFLEKQVALHMDIHQSIKDGKINWQKAPISNPFFSLSDGFSRFDYTKDVRVLPSTHSPFPYAHIIIDSEIKEKVLHTLPKLQYLNIISMDSKERESFKKEWQDYKNLLQTVQKENTSALLLSRDSFFLRKAMQKMQNVDTCLVGNEEGNKEFTYTASSPQKIRNLKIKKDSV